MQIAVAHDIVDELDEREGRVDARPQLNHVRSQFDVEQWRLERTRHGRLSALLLNLFVDQQTQLEQVRVGHADPFFFQVNVTTRRHVRDS